MDRKTDIILTTIVLALVAMAIIGLFVYPAYEAGKVKDKLGENFIFEVQCEVSQTDNNSALLYFTIELPENFSNKDNLVKAKVESIRNSFNRDGDESNLYLGTRDDLLFVQNGSKLENYLTVPDGERLTATIRVHTPIYDRYSRILEGITIEVIT